MKGEDKATSSRQAAGGSGLSEVQGDGGVKEPSPRSEYEVGVRGSNQLSTYCPLNHCVHGGEIYRAIGVFGDRNAVVQTGGNQSVGRGSGFIKAILLPALHEFYVCHIF